MCLDMFQVDVVFIANDKLKNGTALTAPQITKNAIRVAIRIGYIIVLLYIKNLGFP